MESWGSLGGNLGGKLPIFWLEILAVLGGLVVVLRDRWTGSDPAPCDPVQSFKVERKYIFFTVCPICADAFMTIATDHEALVCWWCYHIATCCG